MARLDMSKLSQETLAIIGVGVALAALILTSIAGLRGEIRAVRDELRVEIQAVRTEAHAERQALRAEARADREAFQSQILRLTEVFQSQVLRLTEQQGVLNARIDGFRSPPETNP